MGKVDTHVNVNTSVLEKGQWYGYYEQLTRKNENGEDELVFNEDGSPSHDYSKWVTGQNGPRPMSPEAALLVENWHKNYNSGPAAYWKAVGRDHREFFVEFGQFIFKDVPVGFTKGVKLGAIALKNWFKPMKWAKDFGVFLKEFAIWLVKDQLMVIPNKISNTVKTLSAALANYRKGQTIESSFRNIEKDEKED